VAYRRLFALLAVVAIAPEISCSSAQDAAPNAVAEGVDQSAIDVEVENAFPNLQWPDELTGASEGRSNELRPLLLTGAGDGTNRIFVATQPGPILVFKNDAAVESMDVFLDLSERTHYRVPQENEEGLLGMAFHPKFKENGEFFVYYTGEYDQERNRRSVISRFRVSKDNPNQADPDSEEILLEIPDKFWNHNGGTIVFGPEGYLYVGLGDGGFRGDPDENGQDLGELWGKILRIDVDHKDDGLEYAIPKDNPFVGKQGARGEVWCYGIRNVWRIAFDRETGDLWAGEVGQDLFEEIDIIEKGGNYGWNLREGMHPYGPNGAEPREDLIEPIWEYPREFGKSITGGNVYRGKSAPELAGAYLYADYVSGHIWALWYDKGAKKVTANRTVLENGGPITSFGEDDNGETYYTLQNGDVMKFVSKK
jgi:glucose/arabinose dehydrogenase